MRWRRDGTAYFARDGVANVARARELLGMTPLQVANFTGVKDNTAVNYRLQTARSLLVCDDLFEADFNAVMVVLAGPLGL